MNKEDYSKYYIQGSDHYLIPKDVFKELFNEMINWKEESKKQKEVIDKAIEYIRNHQLVFKDATLEETEDWFNQFYIDVLDILKEEEND